MRAKIMIIAYFKEAEIKYMLNNTMEFLPAVWKPSTSIQNPKMLVSSHTNCHDDVGNDWVHYGFQACCF